MRGTVHYAAIVLAQTTGFSRAPRLRASPEIRHAYQEHKLYLLLHWIHSLEITRSFR